MKTIVLGDSSRYQMLKNLINEKDPLRLEETKTSWLREHTILVTNRPMQKEDGKEEEIDLTVSSSCVPLYTELLFPAETKICSAYGQESNIIVFDEFPYCKGTELEHAKKIKASNPFSSIRIVLYDEKRRSLDTDITNMQEAKEEAKGKYYGLGMETVEYSQTGIPAIFRWSAEDLMKCSLRMGKARIDELNKRLRDFAWNYEVFYLCELEEEVEDRSRLQQFAAFGREMTKGKTVLDIFRDRAEAYFFEKQYAAFFQEKVLMEYSNHLIQDAAYLWDAAQDEKLLIDEIRSSFHDFFKELRNYEYYGKEEGYEKFLNETHVDVNFKNQCISFFQTKMPEIISAHVKRRIQLIGRFVDEK